MDNEIHQLIEMVGCPCITHALHPTKSLSKGATPAQARAALRQCKDVMQAAELFFEGKFDHVKDGDDVQMASSSEVKRRIRLTVRVFTIYDGGLLCTSHNRRRRKMMVQWVSMKNRRIMTTKTMARTRMRRTRMVCQ